MEITGKKVAPILSYQFQVEVEGQGLPSGTAYFNEMSGFGIEYGVIEHKTFSEAGIPLVQKIPGPPTYMPVTLKRGITQDLSFWQWHRMVFNGDLEKARAKVSIRLHDVQYKETYLWSLERAWPSKLTGFQFSTDSNDIVMQELTLVYEGISEQRI